MNGLQIIGIKHIPLIDSDEDLFQIILDAFSKNGIKLVSGDIIVITSKVVSKAEGRVINLNDFTPSASEKSLANQLHKDPKLLSAILSETKKIIKIKNDIMICETSHGFICANAGVDQSNVPKGFVSLLPVNPDNSAEKIRVKFLDKLNVNVAVIITDTFGRPWRNGFVNVAIGVSGLDPILSYRGQIDPYGYNLRVTDLAISDELASAAELVMGKVDNIPVALIRNYSFQPDHGGAHKLVRDASTDIFR